VTRDKWSTKYPEVSKVKVWRGSDGKINKIKSECNSMADSVASAAEEVFFESWFVINLSHAIRDDETLEMVNVLAQSCQNL